jgi:NAD(P)-dependent dehydrogenase (short-subunit alcohol dehydrogenase family)
MEGLAGRVVLVTGAGRGLGRAHALEFARHGARVIVNDHGVTLDGRAGDNPADAVAEEVRAAGGEAVVDRGDVASWDDAKAMIQRGIDEWGRFDVLVNNAGFLRDRMLFKGHFCTLRHAAEYWRVQSKAIDGPVYGRVINTSSESALIGGVGQPNYGPAKAGIAALTMVAANTLVRYGVTANVIAPRARTRMTEDMPGFAAVPVEADGFDPFAPEHVSPLVAYLASPAAAKVSGQLFIVHGREIDVVHGPFVERAFTVEDRWTVDSVGEQLTPFYEQRTMITQGYLMQKDPRS